jgi:hypothetical protein
LHATSDSPAGPWTKHYDPVPFGTKDGTYYFKWNKEQKNFQRFTIAENGPGIGLQIRVTDLDSNGWKDIVCAGKSGTHIFWNDGK